MIDVNDLHTHDLISILMRTKLGESAKGTVVRAQIVFREHGHLPVKEIGKLRVIYTRHSRQIRLREEARERGRISLAKERTNLDDQSFRRIRDRRIDKLAASVNDLGI